jgi:hypothetical protein
MTLNLESLNNPDPQSLLARSYVLHTICFFGGWDECSCFTVVTVNLYTKGGNPSGYGDSVGTKGGSFWDSSVKG